MNNKVAIGLVAAIIVIGVAFVAFQKHLPETVQIPLGNTPAATTTEPAPEATNTSSPAATSGATTPAPSQGPVVTQVSSTPVRLATFDQLTFTTSSTHPVVTGKANVKTVGIVLDDPKGVGIAGSFEIPVEEGHWSFSVPQALKPGTYTLHLIGGDNKVDAKLVVTAN